MERNLKTLKDAAKPEVSAAERAYRKKRQIELAKIRSERDRKFRLDEQVKLDREQMMTYVSSIIFKHVFTAEMLIPKPTEGAALFNESNQTRPEWMIQKTSGFSSTLPMFVYSYEPVTKPVIPCTEE